MVLAGMMGMSALSLTLPASAQQRNWENRGGEQRGMRGPGDGGGGRWNGGQRAMPAQATAPQQQADRGRWNGQQPGSDGWRGDNRPNNDGRPDNDNWHNGQSGTRWSSGTVGARPDRRNWNDNDRRDNDRRDGNWRNDDRRDNDRWRNGQPNWNQGNWAYTGNRQRFDDRNRWNDQRRWDNGWRSDRRYDWQNYRARYGSIYRPGPYYAPRGWGYGYRPFSVGVYMDNMWFSDSYWLNDTSRYRLPPAYGSMRWIRYYDDALLVDIRDGYVVDVIRNFFW